MRFTRKNWAKFFGSNKKTTLRLKKSKIGHHKAYAGSYYNPELLGEFDIIGVREIMFKDLTEDDAKCDGFSSLNELKAELRLLNGDISQETIMFQYWIENVKQNESA